MDASGFIHSALAIVAWIVLAVILIVSAALMVLLVVPSQVTVEYTRSRKGLANGEVRLITFAGLVKRKIVSIEEDARGGLAGEDGRQSAPAWDDLSSDGAQEASSSMYGQLSSEIDQVVDFLRLSIVRYKRLVSTAVILVTKKIVKKPSHTFLERLGDEAIELLRQRGVTCTRLEWRTEVGLALPHTTALAAGSIWAAKNALARPLTANFRYVSARPRISVVPNYRMRGITTSFNCILSFSLGYIILRSLGSIVAGFFAREVARRG